MNADSDFQLLSIFEISVLDIVGDVNSEISNTN